MLQSRLGSFEDLVVADLFAGTGALGLEALSRGAAHCTFVETDAAALTALKQNIATLGAGDRATIRPQDATRIAGGPWHLAFLDPPFASGLGAKALAQLIPALAPGALVSVETARGATLDAPGLSLDTERVYGKAKLSLFRNDAI